MTTKGSMPKGEMRLMLGNEAVAWGAIAAGVDFSAGYPGTPASEVMQTLIATSDRFGHYAEWSTNEKVAVEAAAAAAWAGQRSIAVMKHLGLNVASDALMTLAYTGVRGGMVIFSAGDAQCHTSSNEMDARLFGRFANLPVLDPSDPEEAFHLTKKAFEISEKLELPVIVNSTPRLSHASFPLDVSGIEPLPHRPAQFVENKPRWICVAALALRRHRWLTTRLHEVATLLEGFPSTTLVHGGRRLGILTNGVTHNYVMEAVAELGLQEQVSILKVTLSYPFPEQDLRDFALLVDELLVVEELEPVVEDAVRIALQKNGISLVVKGKADGLVAYEGELDPLAARRAIEGALNMEETSAVDVPAELPVRPPLFCPGCPHRSTYTGLKTTMERMNPQPLVVGDIGCYTLVSSYPFEMLDTLLCMGGGAGMAHGFAQASLDRPVLAIMGDSTFFHSGLSSLANIGYHRSNVTVLLLDNQYTAMTGFQANPGTGLTSAGAPSSRLTIPDIARSLGFEDLVTVNAHDSAQVAESLAKAFQHEGPSMVISEGPCALQEERDRSKQGKPRRPAVVVNAELCIGCQNCLRKFGCSAIGWNQESGKAFIDEAKCIGCGDCVLVCPVQAIGGAKR
jgi:indolepyruvate ferredoxin oxidoreductase, alpha subunit